MGSTLMFAVFMGWVLERAQFVMCAGNYGTIYNGVGAVEQTIKRTAMAPMAYRTLVPWMIWLIERLGVQDLYRYFVYQVIKWAVNSLAIYCVALAFGWPAAVVTMVLLLLTFRYDYWDWSVEMAAICAGMSGNLPLTMVLAGLHGLSRETALLTPVAYYLATGDWRGAVYVGCAAVGALLLVRFAVGKRPLYCKRFMWRENLKAITEIFKWYPFFHGDTLISIVITILSILSILSMPTGWPIVLVILAAGWMMGKSDEARIFSAALPWVAAWIVR